MKKLLFLSVFLMVLLLIAEPYPLTLEGFKFSPVSVGSYSHYDYAHGAYDGFPIRVQNENDGMSQGMYVTFMNQATINMNRRQKLAFISWEGENLADSDIVAGTMQEGFGTLGLDLTTGNPFFAWHFNFADGIPNTVHLVYDTYNYNFNPGTAVSELFTVNDNVRPDGLPQHPSPNPTVRAEEFSFIWPVVKIGPSPLATPTEPYQRIYVFMSNSGSSWAPANNTNGYMPSSAMRLAFADAKFMEDDEYFYQYYFNGMEDDLIWTIKRIDYFERAHYHTGTDDQSIRLYPAYAISADGKVSYSGSLQGDPDKEFMWERIDLSTITPTSPPALGATYPSNGIWPGAPGEAYTHFVVINNNYGESPAPGEDGFYVHRMNYRREWDPYHIVAFHHEVAEAPYPGYINGEYNANNVFLYDQCHFTMSPRTVNHHTATFDVYGNLHTPTVFGLSFAQAGDSPVVPPRDEIEDWYTWVGAELIYRIVYNPALDNTRLDRVFPFPEYNVGAIPLPIDLDEDGWIDEDLAVLNDLGQLTTFFKGTLPFYHWDREANRFHNNQLKMSDTNEGVMALMWIDSYKSWRYNQGNDPSYAAYEFQSEIMLTVSPNYGYTWTDPIALSAIETPQLVGTRPSFLYPADRFIKTGENEGTLYFMFTDDVEYGVGTTGQEPSYGGPGAYVKVAGINLSWPPPPNPGNQDIISFKTNMLSQNYPNPFNPTTTISFDIQQPGMVNLSVYNVRGQLVKTIVNDHYISGKHSVQWHGTDNNNKTVASGIYFYKIEANGKQEIKRMVMLK